MFRFKQFIQESIGDVWRSVARHVKPYEPDFSHHLAHMNFDQASHIYHNMPSENKRRVTDALHDHSHYHDVHSEFHQHYKAYQDKQGKPQKHAEFGGPLGQTHKQWFHSTAGKMITHFHDYMNSSNGAKQAQHYNNGAAAQKQIMDKYKIDQMHPVFKYLNDSYEAWKDHGDARTLSHDIDHAFDDHLAHHHA